MDKDSILYLLMDMRVNGILDHILERDEEYQEITRKSGEYLDSLEAMEIPLHTPDIHVAHISSSNNTSYLLHAINHIDRKSQALQLPHSFYLLGPHFLPRSFVTRHNAIPLARYIFSYPAWQTCQAAQWEFP